MKFWDYAAMQIARAIVCNMHGSSPTLVGMYAGEIASAAAQVADKLEEERRNREAKPS